MDHLSNNHEECPNQHENNYKRCNETGHPIFQFDRKSMETETTTWSEFTNGRKPIAEQILVLEEINLKEQV